MDQYAITLDDRAYIESFTKKHPLYSDFNFTSLRSWDIEGHLRIGELHGNLVVRFNDYLTGEPFYSYLGDSNCNETVEHLLALAESNDMNPCLKLVPELSTEGLDHERFFVREDRDHFDYVYDTQEQKMNVFMRRYVTPDPNLLDVAPGTLQATAYNILVVNEAWRKNKMSSKDGLHLKDMQNESEAIQRIFADTHPLLNVICVLYSGRPIGYVIYELLTHEHAVIHFMKADVTFSGISQFLTHTCAKSLSSLGYTHLNCEQDLGLAGLRNSKLSFRPCHFLKKYTVERKKE